MKSLLNNDDFLSHFGRESDVKELVWDDTFHRYKDKVGHRLNDHRLLYEGFVTLCYHGGRNECFGYGPFSGENGVDIVDVDLIGAYIIALTDLFPLDYANARSSKDVSDFMGHVCGFAKVHFTFPDSVDLPSLPVQTGARGLFYPRSGVSYCTAPEVAVAVNLGATIKIELGVIIPWLNTKVRLFKPFVSLVRKKRLYYKRLSDIFSEQLWKEIGNSLYGKIAQGLKNKRAFDSRLGSSRDIAPSVLSNPYYAAHITGFIRAVISEIIAECAKHNQVFSVTTDGFLTDANLDNLPTSGLLASRFCNLLNDLDADIYETDLLGALQC